VSDSSENGFHRESLKRKHVDSESPDTPTSSEAIGHLERKKRLLACVESLNIHKDRISGGSSNAQTNTIKSDSRRELDAIVTSETVKSELAKLLKRRSSSSSGANSDIKYLESKSKQGCVMSLIEQCFFGEHSDTSHHQLADNSNIDSKPRNKHNIISTKTGKCSYGAKDTSAVQPLRIIDATSPLVNHSWPDPRRQLSLSSMSSMTSLSSLSSCSAQLCSSHANCKVHRKLERSDAIYEMSCDSDLTVISRVSSSDIECLDRTSLKQDLVHTTTPKLEDHCSSEVSSSSDKVAAMNKKPPLIGRSLTCPAVISGPLSLPLPEFAITIRAGANNKVTNIPVVQPSQASPKSTTIMSPLGQMSPNSVVPKKLREKSDLILKEGMQCLVSTTDNPDSNNLSDIKTINVSSTKSKNETFEEVSDPEMSPTRSPSRSIEDRIRALDEKYNAWSGTNATTPVVKIEKTPTPTIDYSKYNIKKKSQINSTSSTDSQTSEPSDIVKNLLSKSSIFDQDSKRLELINEKYEPKEVNFESITSPKSKPVFRTKAAAKEFSTPATLQISSISNPTDKLHDSLPKNTLHHSSHHSLHTQSHHTTPHHNHPIPGSLARKLSEPIRLPSAKKEPITPSTPTTPAPSSAPPRSGPNPFTPFSRPSHNPNSSSTITRLPQSNLLGGLNIKKDTTIPNTLPNSTIVGKDVPKNRDPRENRDPRVMAKKDNALHNSIITNTSINMQNIKDQNNSSIKKELSMSSNNSQFVNKSEFAKKASQLQQHSSSLPPHLASSGFSSKAQNPPFSTSQSNQRQDLNKKSDPQVSATKKLSSSDALETHTVSNESEWSRIANDSKDKSIKTEKVRHHSQSSISKDSSENTISATQKKLSEKDKKCDINRPVDKNKVPVMTKLKDEKKCVKNKESKTLPSKLFSKDKEKDKEKEKDKLKSKTESKFEKKTDSSKEVKTSKSDKDREKEKQKKDKSFSKDKSKDTKLKPSEIKMLLEIPDTDEPKYFSMYDKVKARSSANQSLKVAKDMECVRQKFSQLKDKRQHRKDDDRKSSQDSDSDSEDSLCDRIMNKQKKTNLPKKRKIIIETTSDSSSDEEVSANRKSKKLAAIANDSDFDSDFEKSISKTNKKQHKEPIYSSDSSMEDLSAISSPRMTSSSSGSKAMKSTKTKHEDDSSDDEVPQRQIKKKTELKKKVKKEKDKSKIEATKENAKETKTDKSDNKPKIVSDKTLLQKVKKNKLSREKGEKDKERERKRSSGDDNEDSKQKIAKRKKKKAKNPKLKEKRHSSSNSKDKSNDDKSTKHNDSSSKQETNISSDHEMRSSGMSDLEECLKRAYPEVKTDESDSETRTHVIKCYNKEQNKELNKELNKEINKEQNKEHNKEHNKEQARGVVSHTEWEKSETTKPNEKSVSNNNNSNNNNNNKVLSKTNQYLPKMDKSDNRGNKSPKKLTKESVIHKESEITKKKENKSAKDDKAVKEEVKKKKMKKQSKYKDREKDKKEDKEKVTEKTKDKDKDKDKERDREKDKKNKLREDLMKVKSPSPPPKTPEPLKSSPYSDLICSRDNDSSSSDSKVDEDIIKNARRLEECMMAADASDDTNSSNDDLIPSTASQPKPTTNLVKPSKDEKLQQQRRYEEEAAIQSLRLQKELMETSDLKEIKLPFDELMTNVSSLKSNSDVSNAENKPIIDETIFAINSVTNKDVFSDAESVVKIDENKESEIDDQRKMEDDLAVAALLQDMNDPVIKDNDEEQQQYPAPPQEQIDEISYLGMLGDEEPPLQIAESPPEPLNDELALKSIAEEISEKINSNIKEESDEEICKNDENEPKPEPVVSPIVEEMKRASNDWPTEAINPIEITSEMKSEENIIKSPEHKVPEIEVMNDKSDTIEMNLKEELQTKEIENNSFSIDNKEIQVFSTCSDSSTNIVNEKEKKEVEKDKDKEILLSSTLLPSLADTVPDDKRETCSDGGVSDKTEIFEEEVDNEQHHEEFKQKYSTPSSAEVSSNVSTVETKLTPTDESESDDKKTCERPRRGRRAKTRKYSESSLQLPRYETGCVTTISASNLTTSTTPSALIAVTPKRGPKPTVERTRRSGRTSGMESATDEQTNDNELSGDEQNLKIDEHQHEEEPKKANKRGRKKKVSGTFNSAEIAKSIEETQKKERILLSLPVPTDKNATDVRKTNSPYDVFEFRDSDEEDAPQLPLEPIHNKSSEIVKQQIIAHSVPENAENSVKKQSEETQVIKAVDHHQDQTSKEYVSEVSQHGKLSITIRLHSKDGQDGNTTGTAEVVKTSKAVFSEDDTKVPKVETTTDSHQNKGLRKSARLMSQVPKTTVDETIEDVIKGTLKDEGKSKRITRSARKSEESLDLDDDHNDGKLYYFSFFQVFIHLFNDKYLQFIFNKVSLLTSNIVYYPITLL
jgi:hypothetical protein